MNDSDNIDLGLLYALMRPRKVCTCMSVSEEQIVAAIQSDCDTFEKIQDKTHAATNCGNCSARVRSILERELSKKIV